jgi:hypothetical protein
MTLLIRQTLVERADACCLNEPSWADIPMRARYGLEHRNMSHTVNRPAKAFFCFASYFSIGPRMDLARGIFLVPSSIIVVLYPKRQQCQA